MYDADDYDEPEPLTPEEREEQARDKADAYNDWN